MKKTFSIVALLLLLAACASKKATTSGALTDADGARAAAKYSGASLATLQKGKLMYEENCGTCHSLKSTTDYNPEQWGKHVKRMATKAKIDAATETLILQYVVTMCGQ
jgi:cytochrome c5